MKCSVKKKKGGWWGQWKDAGAKPDMEYTPGPGNHFFTYKGKKLWAVTHEGESLITGWERKPTKQEILYICCYG